MNTDYRYFYKYRYRLQVQVFIYESYEYSIHNKIVMNTEYIIIER